MYLIRDSKPPTDDEDHCNDCDFLCARITQRAICSFIS